MVDINNELEVIRDNCGTLIRRMGRGKDEMNLHFLSGNKNSSETIQFC